MEAISYSSGFGQIPQIITTSYVSDKTPPPVTAQGNYTNAISPGKESMYDLSPTTSVSSITSPTLSTTDEYYNTYAPPAFSAMQNGNHTIPSPTLPIPSPYGDSYKSPETRVPNTFKKHTIRVDKDDHKAILTKNANAATEVVTDSYDRNLFAGSTIIRDVQEGQEITEQVMDNFDTLFDVLGETFMRDTEKVKIVLTKQVRSCFLFIALY